MAHMSITCNLLMFQKEKKCNSAYLKPVDGRRGPPIMKSCTDRKRNGGEGEVRKKDTWHGSMIYGQCKMMTGCSY